MPATLFSMMNITVEGVSLPFLWIHVSYRNMHIRPFQICLKISVNRIRGCVERVGRLAKGGKGGSARGSCVRGEGGRGQRQGSRMGGWGGCRGVVGDQVRGRWAAQGAGEASRGLWETR